MGENMKVIFVADDEESIREDVAEILEGEGYLVFCFSKAEEVWEEIDKKEGRPDLLITDWNTKSKMDGIELKDKVRAKLPTTPIILMSGYSRPDDCPASEFFDFFQKPVGHRESKDFLKVVKKFL